MSEASLLGPERSSVRKPASVARMAALASSFTFSSCVGWFAEIRWPSCYSIHQAHRDRQVGASSFFREPADETRIRYRVERCPSTRVTVFSAQARAALSPVSRTGSGLAPGRTSTAFSDGQAALSRSRECISDAIGIQPLICETAYRPDDELEAGQIYLRDIVRKQNPAKGLYGRPEPWWWSLTNVGVMDIPQCGFRVTPRLGRTHRFLGGRHDWAASAHKPISAEISRRPLRETRTGAGQRVTERSTPKSAPTRLSAANFASVG